MTGVSLPHVLGAARLVWFRACLAVVLLGGASGATAQTAPAQKPWWARISLDGDFRLRGELTTVEGHPGEWRGRFRFRLAASLDVNPDLQLHVRLATGDPLNPTSTNQTFGDGLGRKPLNLDRAYLLYRPTGLGGLTLGGGKFQPPVRHTQMTWDNDVNWEGAYEALTLGTGRVRGRLVAAQSPLDTALPGPDALLFAEQAALETGTSRRRLDVAVADYRVVRADQVATAIDAGLLHTKNTNALRMAADGRLLGFLSGFHLVDAIAEATFAADRSERPLLLTANVVHNMRASASATGVWLSARIGRAVRPHTALAGYTFGRLERESVLSPFNYSNAPGTNYTMHQVALTYAPLERTAIDLTITTHRRIEGPRLPTTRVAIDARVTF